MMNKPGLAILLSWCYFTAFSQGGVVEPGNYYYTVKDCFLAAKYKAGFKPDTLPASHILKGRRIWRTIGFNNAQNRLVFNSDKDCMEISLFEIIKFGLLEKQLHAFLSDNFDEAMKNLVDAELVPALLTIKDSAEVLTFDANGNEVKQKQTGTRVLSANDVKSYLLKEDWVFNSYSGKTEKYIVGIAPLVMNNKAGKVVPLFWLYYPEWEQLFRAFQTHNIYSGELSSFSQIFAKRSFVSTISKESNVFDRGIKSYAHGYEAELESELIKEKMLNSESDLFEY